MYYLFMHLFISFLDISCLQLNSGAVYCPENTRNNNDIKRLYLFCVASEKMLKAWQDNEEKAAAFGQVCL